MAAAQKRNQKHVCLACLQQPAVMLVLTVCAFYTMTTTNAFHFPPDWHPRTFVKGEDVPLNVNALTSVHTLIPKDYYQLPFCKGDDGRMAEQNLGEFLTGNKIQSSPYLVKMLEEVRCRIICQTTLTHAEAFTLGRHIKYGYHHNWLLDNLPSANVAVNNGNMQKHYAGGFPVGFVDSREKVAYVFNHVKIIVDYHIREDGYRVVGFGVEPTSVKHRFAGGYEWDGSALEGFSKNLETCPSATSDFISQDMVDTVQIVKPGEQIIYTYDVTWMESEVPWSDRWDVYLTEDHFVPPQVHWFSIVNSCVVIFFLSITVTCILVRNLRRDVAASKGRVAPSMQDDGGMDDEKGWKALHADVFRPPQTRSMLFCVLVGSGAHLAVTGFSVIVLSMLGLSSPARRDSLWNTTVCIYTLSSSLAGYVSGRLYKTICGNEWEKCCRITATLFPGIAFGIFLFCNLILSSEQSTGAVQFLYILMLVGMWCLIGAPLVFVGYTIGYFKTRPLEFPTTTSETPRPVPPPGFAWRIPILSMLLAGISPFGAVYVELFFIMTSLWMNQFYYTFGFAFIVYLILLVTAAQVTILCVYYRLKAENHQWWWQSFFWAGSTGFYVFVYSMIWYGSLEAKSTTATLIYFGYMLLLFFAVFLGVGAVGFIASMLFVRRMYSVINQAEEGYVELLDRDGSMEEGEGMLAVPGESS